MKATVPAMVGLIVFLYCSWRVHQSAINQPQNTDTVEITVYGQDGKVIRPIFHR